MADTKFSALSAGTALAGTEVIPGVQSAANVYFTPTQIKTFVHSTYGTGVVTALGVNVGSAGAPVLYNGDGGTPSAITLTNGTGLPLTTGVTGTLPVANGGTGITSFGTGVATALGINVGSAGAFTTNNAANSFTASQTFNAATSSIYLGANGGNLGVATLYGSTSGSVTLKPAAAAGTGTVFQLPATNGTSGYVLQTDGAGVTSWVAPSGGGTPGGSDTQVQFNDGGSFGGDAGLTFNKTDNALTITGGTATASTPVLNITQTFNNGAVNFTLSRMTITNTASDGYGFFADWKVGTSDVFKFRQDGNLRTYSLSCNTVGSGNSNAAIDYFGGKWTVGVVSGGQFAFGSDASQVYAGVDTAFSRNAAGVIELNNGTTGTYRDLKLRNLMVPDATGSIGYSTGSGGAVTQATSRTTGVTLNKPAGAITLVSAAGSTSWNTFTVTNSTVAATDTVVVNQKSGTDKYMIHVTAVGAGSFDITFATTGGTTTEQPVFNFAVIKAVAA